MTAPPWRQYTITVAADHRVTHTAVIIALAPALHRAEASGRLEQWWFLHKDPWPLRFRAERANQAGIEQSLAALRDAGLIRHWVSGIYEPETVAFGGEAAMAVAHQLFHLDSRFRATLTPQTAHLGPRETFVVAAVALCRAAGLDQFEQGDVWARFAALRPQPRVTVTARLAEKMHRLLACDPQASLDADTTQDPTSRHEWLTGLRGAGQDLARLARCGRLTRGLRAVLAHHLLFLANRAGLPLVDQADLALLAVTVTFHNEPSNTATSKVPMVTQTDTADPSADQLRASLVDRLERNQTARSPQVIAALRTVPREMFVPHVPPAQAYTDDAIYTKNNTHGVAISAASQPTIVATMLEQLDLHPGQTVFEAGAGTGYNAALLGHIVGPDGHVTTLDVDQDLVDDARAHLRAAGISNVEVVLGDAALGHAPHAPYDRAMATVGAYQIPTAWLNQLAPHGRLLVPLRLRGTTTRCIAFERDEHGWHDVNSDLAVFMPLRGIADDARRQVWLTEQHDIMIEVHKDQTVEPGNLAGVLHTKRHEIWTGVLFPPNVPYAWMDLWLACTLDNALMRMAVQRSAVDRGDVTPMFGWGSMATVNDRDLAYLTVRPAPPAADGGKLYEVGIIGHGPTGDALAATAAHEVLRWDSHYRDRQVAFTIPTALPEPQPNIGRFVLPRTENPLVVTWM